MRVFGVRIAAGLFTFQCRCFVTSWSFCAGRLHYQAVKTATTSSRKRKVIPNFPQNTLRFMTIEQSGRHLPRWIEFSQQKYLLLSSLWLPWWENYIGKGTKIRKTFSSNIRYCLKHARNETQSARNYTYVLYVLSVISYRKMWRYSAFSVHF